MANIHKSTIQSIENAKFNVTLDTIISIANALEMPLSEFIDFKLS